MLNLIPKLKSRFPELELHVFSGLAVYDRLTAYDGPEKPAFQRLAAQLATVPGIVLRGNVRQDELAREFMRSSVLLYPNTMFETCCMVALEAQAAGCPVVCSRNSGLIESVGRGGILIGGVPGSPDYLERVIDATIYLLSNRSKWQELSTEGRQRVQRRFTWHAVAQRLETVIQGILER